MKNRVIPTLSAAKGRNLALFLGPSEIPRFARNDRHFQSSEGPAPAGLKASATNHLKKLQTDPEIGFQCLQLEVNLPLGVV